MLLTIEFLQEALQEAHYFVGKQDTVVSYNGDSYKSANTFVSLAVDSKQIEAGEIFVALVGKKVDGHLFIEEALKRGAVALVVNNLSWVTFIKPDLLQDVLIITIKDTYKALYSLAQVWRSRFSIPVVGITGSMGKTTTKEMLRTIFNSAGIPALVSLKNQNTVIGLCLNILKIRPEHKIAVFEVGISLQNEMEERVALLRPTIGVITLLANSHAEGLGGLSGISREKRKIFSFFGPTDVGIINGDQALLTEAYYHHPIAKFGLKMKNQVQARKISCIESQGVLKTNFTLKWYGQKAAISLVGCHSGYVNNALAAATVAYFLHISLLDVVNGLNAYRGFENRFEIRQLNSGLGRVISDCCNANPESMRIALEAFDTMHATGPKIALLGDMLELGSKEDYWHRQLGRMIRKTQTLNTVILVGERACLAVKTIPQGIEVITAVEWQEAREKLLKKIEKNALILIKASLGMNFSKIVYSISQ